MSRHLIAVLVFKKDTPDVYADHSAKRDVKAIRELAHSLGWEDGTMEEWLEAVAKGKFEGVLPADSVDAIND